MRLSSRREIMEKLGKQNIPELLDEIDEDFLHQALVQAKVSTLSMAMGGSPTPNAEGEESDESSEQESFFGGNEEENAE